MAFQVLGDTVIDQNQIITSPKLILEGTSASESILSGSLNGDSKLEIKADGSATFAGNAKSGALDLSNTSAAGIEVRSTGEILLQRPSSQGTSSLIDGRLGSTQTVNILANGAATFAGTVTVNAPYNQGGLSIQAGADGYSSPLIVRNASGDDYFEIAGDGSSTFSESVAVGSASSRLTAGGWGFQVYGTSNENGLALYN